MNKFEIGDRVIVTKNSNRNNFLSFLGERGKIIGYKASLYSDNIDYTINFDNGKLYYICENDLSPDMWKTIKFEDTKECYEKMANLARKTHSSFSVEYYFNQVIFKLDDEEYHIGEELEYQTLVDTDIIVEPCPCCGGSGITSKSIVTRRCSVCNGHRMVSSYRDYKAL